MSLTQRLQTHTVTMREQQIRFMKALEQRLKEQILAMGKKDPEALSRKRAHLTDVQKSLREAEQAHEALVQMNSSRKATR